VIPFVLFAVVLRVPLTPIHIALLAPVALLYARVVLLSPVINIAVLVAMFVVFMVAGTALFVRRETSR
jgi:hypothetical protein